VAADDAGSFFVLDVDVGSMVALEYFSVTKVLRSRLATVLHGKNCCQ